MSRRFSSTGSGAEVLACLGYDLILTARGAEALQATARRLAVHGMTVRAIAGDVSDPAHRRRLAEAAAEKGRLVPCAPSTV